MPDSSGYVATPQAALMARGFQQIHGVEYCETYAPVVRITSIRSLLAIFAHLYLYLHQMDMVTAILNVELDEDVDMEVSEGVTGFDRKPTTFTLAKALHGLKQTPRRWNTKIDSFLKNLGFISSRGDPCFYFKGKSGKTETS